uniref:Uncharacterized protein n=1 Tax=Oryza glumipatula TaxID=40148 RepID=A0A0E0BQX1_9ORYZ
MELVSAAGEGAHHPPSSQLRAAPRSLISSPSPRCQEGRDPWLCAAVGLVAIPPLPATDLVAISRSSGELDDRRLDLEAVGGGRSQRGQDGHGTLTPRSSPCQSSMANLEVVAGMGGEGGGSCDGDRKPYMACSPAAPSHDPCSLVRPASISAN